ncbi:putative sulfate/molybdate transporter [Haladaptatus sp. DYSN1]|uniref:putative sulfate/molybdate transporter n=1 Tax=unclassified Haladaptatus TaxID=2622732 RepID=UPI0024052E7F|nr:putative sulfate/molybdate transporter [Haladaptatus sp. DYSN1]
MAIGHAERTHPALKFTTNELTGALGDSITALPLIVAIGTLTEASLAHILLFFGLFQVVWGVRYGLPLSVEPMKALAGLAIAGAITHGELVAAGLLAGGILLVAGRLGTLSRLSESVGLPVIRGVQLAVALLLAQTGLSLGVGDPAIAVGGVALVGVVALFGYTQASALVVLGVGVFVALSQTPFTVSVPSLALFPAGPPTLSLAATEGLAGQLAMTVGNAAVATSLLLSDLFDRDVSADRLAGSMGSMNLLAVPLGGLPMCHGSGGLAGKYAFGARTGGANVILGVLYGLAALVAGVLVGFPMALLGVLLVVVALQLGRVSLESDHLPVTIAVGLLGLVFGVGVAFVVGLAGWWLLSRRA